MLVPQDAEAIQLVLQRDPALAQICTGQIRAGQIGTPQAGPAQIGLLEVHVPHIGLAQVGTEKDRATEIAPRQRSTSQQ